MRGETLFDEDVAHDYEAWYEHGYGLWAVRQEEALLRKHLALFPGAVSLLDVGCGTGHFTRWFARQGLRAVGLDESAAMLAQARARNGLTYLQGSALDLPFDGQSMDLVAMITTLEFIADPVLALREAMRVARRGLLLGVLSQRSLPERLRLFRGQRPVGVLARAHRFRVDELRRLVREAAGARSVRVTWRTTIFPGRLPIASAPAPWGEYLGMAVLLGPPEERGR